MAAVKVSLLDLTVDQVEQLEMELGRPVDQWRELPSRMTVYRRVYRMVTGLDDAVVGAMPMRELMAAVDLVAAEPDEDTETGNPTSPPTP